MGLARMIHQRDSRVKPEDPRKKGSGVFFGRTVVRCRMTMPEKDSRPLFPGRRAVLPPAGTTIRNAKICAVRAGVRTKK